MLVFYIVETITLTSQNAIRKWSWLSCLYRVHISDYWMERLRDFLMKCCVEKMKEKGPNQKVSAWSRNGAMANNIDCLITKQNNYLYLIPPKLEFRPKKKQMTTELFKNSSNSHRNSLILCVFSVSPIKIFKNSGRKKQMTTELFKNFLQIPIGIPVKAGDFVSWLG